MIKNGNLKSVSLFNVGVETNPYTNEIYCRPPNIDKYIESTKVYEDDIDPTYLTIKQSFWDRKRDIYNNQCVSEEGRTPVGYYIEDERVFLFDVNERALYTEDVSNKYFKYIKRNCAPNNISM